MRKTELLPLLLIVVAISCKKEITPTKVSDLQRKQIQRQFENERLSAEYLDSIHLHPYQYKVVQQPGPGNALGAIKFMMPNNLSIYLPDTPQGQLFENGKRAFSHGCIRLKKTGSVC